MALIAANELKRKMLIAVDSQPYVVLEVSLQLPQYVELAVVSADLGLRGDTATGGATKQATLETGLPCAYRSLSKRGNWSA